MDHWTTREVLESGLVRSEATEDNSRTSEVYQVYLYAAEALSDPKVISARRFQLPCLVRDEAVLEVTLLLRGQT